MAKTILVIDDEELVTESLKKLLKREGYNVIIAKDGREALEQIREYNFNLIITDIRMPELNGIETIRNIRDYLNQKRRKSIPEILITGYSSENSIKEAQELKVADYIYKPFNIKDFLAIVKKNLK
jgi:two-component system response regulator HydG/two-component system response regulator AtoC